VTTEALDRVTLLLLLSVIVGEALAVVVTWTAPVATDEGVGATELAVYAFNPLVITVITPPDGQSTMWTRKTRAENRTMVECAVETCRAMAETVTYRDPHEAVQGAA